MLFLSLLHQNHPKHLAWLGQDYKKYVNKCLCLFGVTLFKTRTGLQYTGTCTLLYLDVFSLLKD